MQFRTLAKSILFSEINNPSCASGPTNLSNSSLTSPNSAWVILSLFKDRFNWKIEKVHKEKHREFFWRIKESLRLSVMQSRGSVILSLSLRRWKQAKKNADDCTNIATIDEATRLKFINSELFMSLKCGGIRNWMEIIMIKTMKITT